MLPGHVTFVVAVVLHGSRRQGAHDCDRGVVRHSTSLLLARDGPPLQRSLRCRRMCSGGREHQGLGQGHIEHEPPEPAVRVPWEYRPRARNGNRCVTPSDTIRPESGREGGPLYHVPGPLSSERSDQKTVRDHLRQATIYSAEQRAPRCVPAPFASHVRRTGGVARGHGALIPLELRHQATVSRQRSGLVLSLPVNPRGVTRVTVPFSAAPSGA